MLISGFAVAFAAAEATNAYGQTGAKERAADQKSRVSLEPVQVFGGTSIVPGSGSMLVRSKEGVYMSLHSSNLEPGTAVTAWWVFFNNPSKCAGSPCTPADLSNPEVEGSLVHAAGRVVGVDGGAEFGAFRAAGDTTNTHSGTGLINPLKAEIHLVIRSHGPAMTDDPAALAQQLSLFNGGCPPNTCGNVHAAVHLP